MKLVLNTIGSRYGSIDALNANFEAIQDAFDNTLSRDGTAPNFLEAALDVNSQRVINLSAPVDGTDAVNKTYVDTITSTITQYISSIQTVANNITSVVNVANNIGVINSLSEPVILVAGQIDAVVDVANNIGSVELIGLDLNGAFEQGVIYDFGAITDPAVGSVSPTTSSIVIVADDIASVISVATNIAAVIGAEASAATATTQAGIATTQAGIATTQAASATSSATTATTQAGIATTQASNADTSAVAAAISEGNSLTYSNNAASSASTATTAKDDAVVAKLAAESALASTLSAYDSFDDRYLGAKASDPTLDNDGNTLLGGALYFQTGAGMKVWTGSTWEFAYVPGATYLAKANNLSDLTNTTTARTNLGLGTAATTASTAYATSAQGALADSAFQTASAGALAYLSTVGTTYITNNAVTIDKLAATLDYGSIA
jgi:hypothetical protein